MHASSRFNGPAAATGLLFLVCAALSAQAASPLLAGCKTQREALSAEDPVQLECLPQSRRTELLERPVKPPMIAPLDQDYRLRSALHQWKAREAEALAIPLSDANNPLVAYLDGRAMESLRSQALKDTEASIARSQARILPLSIELKAAARAANDWIHRQPGRDLPRAYRHRIVYAAVAILVENDVLRDRFEEREQVNEVYDRELDRLFETQG